MELTADEGVENLHVLFQKNLSNAIDSTKSAYCDIHDLLAIINTTSDDVTVYRAVNGQTAFTAKFPDQYEDAKPCLVSWKPDGSLLGVGWDDGSCCLYSGEDGKLVARLSAGQATAQPDWQLDLAPQFRSVEQEESDHSRQPACLAWTSHQRSIQSHGAHQVKQATYEPTTEDWFDGVEVSADGKVAARMTHQNGVQDMVDSITTLDVTKVLPGLSSLPSHGARGGPEAAKFTTQSGVDTAFQSLSPASGGIDTLLLSDRSGHANIYLDDSVKVGDVVLDMQPSWHAAHPECPSQVLLSRLKSSTQLHFIDLPLDALGGSLLHVVASNTKRLQSLITYISQTVRCLQHDFTSGQQLPTRILNGLKAELEDKGEADPISTLFELSMTGRFTPAMIEWLTDIIKDTLRGRWEQAVIEMYHHIQNHIFVHLLPALDRLAIAASSLRGLAKLHEGTTAFDVAAQLFTDLSDTADAVRLVATKVQLIATAELRQFYAFIHWLKVMVDVATAGPGSKTAIENEQKESTKLDVGLAGAYITQTMNKSKLAVYLEQLSGLKGSLEKDEFFNHPIVKQLDRKHVVSAMQNSAKKAHKGGSDEQSELTTPLNVPALTARLVSQARLCLDSITTWQQAMLTKQAVGNAAACEVPIDQDSTILDVKMLPVESNGILVYVLCASHTGNDSVLKLFRVHKTAMQTTPADSTEIHIEEAKILHAQFIDHDICHVLLEATVPETANWQYVLLGCQRDVDGNQGVIQWRRRVLHDFSSSPDRVLFKPKYFISGGLPGKRVVVAFGGDDKSWQVLDLNAAAADADA